MKGLYILLMYLIASRSLYARITPNQGSTFDVLKYGAIGNGETDDSNAFVEAWHDVCGTTQNTPTLIIPEGKTFMLQPLSFQGPCKSSTIKIELKGTITAPKEIETWNWTNGKTLTWVEFAGISGLVINEEGNVNGQGAVWWNKYPRNANNRPTALAFSGYQNLTLSDLTHINSPRNHISVGSCKDVFISNLHIIAPENSTNTDGIDIASSSNIVISDDCIAINGGSSFINITGVFCGPGHGISVGSLGKGGVYDTVEEVHVKNCTFTRSSNGGRIKTWKGGRGYARNITYEDIKLVAVNNPVIIDQSYGTYNYDSASQAVEISDVTFGNIYGTSISENAIQLNCDPNIGCTNIVLHQISITRVSGGEANASCTNAHGRCSSCSPNVPCLFENSSVIWYENIQ